MTEEFQSPKYQVNIGAGQGIAVGDGSMVIQQLQEEWLIEETLDDVQAESFVVPTHGKAIYHTLQSQHLLVVCGANRMGKAALSRYIAYLLETEHSPWSTYRMRRRSELQDLVDNLNLQKETTVLVYDSEPFEPEDILPAVQEMAVKTGNFVIMTTDVLESSIEVPVECEPCIVQVTMGSPYTQEDLRQLLRNRIGHLLPQLEDRRMSIQDLVYKLGSPSQIVRFSDILLAKPSVPDLEELEETIRTLQNIDLEINRWLSGLEKNERYLALALALLDDLPEKRFWRLYENMVSIWQRRDPTLLPLDYYALEKFRGFISLGPRFAFQESDYRNAVLHKLLPQYRRSLVAVLPFFQKVAERDDGAHKISRITVAQAVGEIGTAEWSEVESILLSWATHRSARVRASTSHAFREMFEYLGIDALHAILGKLDQWLAAYSPEKHEDDTAEKGNIRWTVASSLGRIGRVVPRQIFVSEILPRLSNLSRDDNYHVRRSAVYALRSLAIGRFASVHDILNERAADWHPAVRSEVVTVIYELRVFRWTEARGLLISWLEGTDKEQHWTALWAALHLASEKPALVEKIYELSQRNANLRVNLRTIITGLLKQEEAEDRVLVKLGYLVRRDNAADSFLIIEPMIEALDRDYVNGRRLLRYWQSRSDLVLQQAVLTINNELNSIQLERKRRWQIMLKHYLDDQDELQAFAATLPPKERQAFWREVEEKRRERERARSRQTRIVLITIGVLVVILCCISTCYSFNN